MKSFPEGFSEDTNSGRAFIAKIVACQLLRFHNSS